MKATKNRGKASRGELGLADVALGFGQGDGQDEEDRDQAGDDRDLEDAGVRGLHLEEEDAQQEAGDGQADGGLDQVLREDGQDGKDHQSG